MFLFHTLIQTLRAIICCLLRVRNKAWSKNWSRIHSKTYQAENN